MKDMHNIEDYKYNLWHHYIWLRQERNFQRHSRRYDPISIRRVAAMLKFRRKQNYNYWQALPF